MKILITGGSSGIGLSILKKILNNEIISKIYLVSRSTKSYYLSLGISEKNLEFVNLINLNISDLNQLKSLVSILENDKIDVVINNAGAFLEKSSNSFVNDMLILNSFAPYYISKALIRSNEYIKIINVSSFLNLNVNTKDLKNFDLKMSGKSPFKIYCLSKFFLNMLSQYLLSQNNNTEIICANPGIIKSNFGLSGNSVLRKALSLARNLIGKHPDEFSEKVINYIIKNENSFNCKSNNLVQNNEVLYKLLSMLKEIKL